MLSRQLLQFVEDSLADIGEQFVRLERIGGEKFLRKIFSLTCDQFIGDQFDFLTPCNAGTRRLPLRHAVQVGGNRRAAGHLAFDRRQCPGIKQDIGRREDGRLGGEGGAAQVGGQFAQRP